MRVFRLLTVSGIIDSMSGVMERKYCNVNKISGIRVTWLHQERGNLSLGMLDVTRLFRTLHTVPTVTSEHYTL